MSFDDISRDIALILRHKSETIGITLDEHGWAIEQILYFRSKSK
jgi:putative RNA 2'-phosphotransferase